MLGFDWFNQTGVTIDPAKRELLVKDKRIRLNENYEDFEQDVQILSLNDDKMLEESIDMNETYDINMSDDKDFNHFIDKNNDVFS